MTTRVAASPVFDRRADGNLEVDELGRDFIGCERVELWACRSGVNLSTHILTPFFVDEAFGMPRCHTVE